MVFYLTWVGLYKLSSKIWCDLAHKIPFPLIGSKGDIELKENQILDGLVDVTHNDDEILFDLPEIDILDTPVEIPDLHQETDEQ